MAEFDPKVWVNRAWDRHTKRMDGKTPEGRLVETGRLTADLDAIKGIEAVVAWCNFRRIRVIFTSKSGGVYDPESREIHINSRQSIENQLYTLLHECGHLLIDDRSQTTEFRFRKGYYVLDEDVRRSFVHRVSIVDEEFEAWARGRKLAKKLGVKINDDVFDELKAKFLKSYMLWAVGDPKYQQLGPA
jgi:IrrE N-terminal-like domain